MSCVVYSNYSSNAVSKGEDALKIAMLKIFEYLEKELEKDSILSKEWRLTYKNFITLEEAFTYVKMRGATHTVFSTNFLFNDNDVFKDRRVVPDGGVIWLENIKCPSKKFPLLFSEMKTQGTNKGRKEAGEEPQAEGNAIDRLGKLTMFALNLYEYDYIAPFVTFCSGCDFNFEGIFNTDESAEDKEDKKNKKKNKKGSTGGKLVTLNGGFAPFNTVYTTKNIPKNKRILPSTIMAREEAFSVEEMFDILKEVGLDSFNNVRKNILKNSK